MSRMCTEFELSPPIAYFIEIGDIIIFQVIKKYLLEMI